MAEHSPERLISDELLSLLHETGVGLWAYDGRGDSFIVNSTCRALLGLSPDEPITKARMLSTIHPDDLPVYVQMMQQSEAGNGDFSIEYRTLLPDGSVRFLSGRGRVRSQGLSSASQVHGVLIDVSERRSLQKQLHDTELRLQALADSFPGLFCYIDASYIVRYISQRFCEHYSRPHAELVNQPLAEIIGAERFASRKPIFDAALNGVPHSFEDTCQRPGGVARHYTVTHYPYRHEGEVRGFMTIGLDITELRNTERALQERTHELSRSNRELEHFASVASHDLKTPLRAIEALVEWLREDLAGHDNPQVRSNLALLGQRATRLHRLLDDLLAYARAGRNADQITRADTGEMVRDIGVLLAPPAGMRIDADAGLPVIATAAAPLAQVLRNLIGNAVGHHPSGEGTVRVSAESRADEVLFSVEDDGAGIPEEFAEKAFQMFQTLRPAEESPGSGQGSGMGLAIVKRIVEAQGGRVWFSPGRGGRGTVFRFNWKVAPTGATEHSPEPLVYAIGR